MLSLRSFCVLLLCLAMCSTATAQARKAKPKKPAPAKVELTFPPELPGGKQVVTDTSEAFLKPGETLREGVAIAKTPPTVDFLYYPGQNYEGKPWSNWGDGIAADGRDRGEHLLGLHHHAVSRPTSTAAGPLRSRLLR